MPVIAYRRQPWAFVDQLVSDLCPAGYELRPMARDASRDECDRALADAEYLMGSWVTTSVTLSDEDFQAAPRLKLLQLMSAGYDLVPLDIAARFGVPVATFGDAMAPVVAEHTLLLILSVLRRLPLLNQAVRSGAWRTREPELRELFGKRVGLVGMGYIGRAVAERLRGFGCSVAYFSRSRLSPEDETALGLTCLESLETLLRDSDIVSLHVALTPSTRGLIGARELALMRPESVLINTTRGGVVDQAALHAALQSGGLWGAGLDVLEPEPPATDDPLLSLPNVVLTPHNGGQSEAVWPRIVRTCFANVERVAAGEAPRFVAQPLT
jgi:phosphoglycerate dehydrogenase-like enzyme